MSQTKQHRVGLKKSQTKYLRNSILKNKTTADMGFIKIGLTKMLFQLLFFDLASYPACQQRRLSAEPHCEVLRRYQVLQTTFNGDHYRL